MLQQLIQHMKQDALLAAACAAQVFNAIAGLLRHTREDFKVLDILKLLQPLGVWLKQTGTAVPEQLGEHLIMVTYSLHHC